MLASTLPPAPPCPEGFGLGDFKAVLFDSTFNNIPIAWGFPLTEQLGEEKFAELKARTDGQPEFVSRGSGGSMSWAFVTRWLTPGEAEAMFGKIAAVAVGPRGGHKSVTYGTVVFYDKHLKPTAAQLGEWKASGGVETVVASR